MTFSNFLFCPGTPIGEGHWLDWQTDATKAEIFLMAQHWFMQSSLVLQEQAHTLLAIAVFTKALPLWRKAPEQCVKALDWKRAMGCLNGCRDVLTLADIERIPTGGVNFTPLDLMLKSAQLEYHWIARCIELQAGPGLWVQHVFKGGEDETGRLYRRKQAWENMKLAGLDAWALIQYYRPASSFEESMEDFQRDKAVVQHEAWARQWWVQCVLGMSPEQARQMAVCVRAPVVVDDAYQVDTSLFADNVLQ